MKTKEEILKMSKEELNSYKWSEDLDLKNDCTNCTNCSNCSDCLYCSYCFDCSNCSYCFNCSNCLNLANGLYCRNLKFEKKDLDKYWICNVEVTKKEFMEKKKEITRDLRQVNQLKLLI